MSARLFSPGARGRRVHPLARSRPTISLGRPTAADTIGVRRDFALEDGPPKLASRSWHAATIQRRPSLAGAYRAARSALWTRGAQARASGRNLATALRGGGPHMVGATEG